MKTFSTLILVAAFSAALPVLGAGNDTSLEGVQLSQAAMASDMAEGEVRKIDKENMKVTLKHGEIRNLDMPAMTMVFQVKDATMLDKVKPGDKVKFKAEKAGNAIVLTDIQIAK